jgi:cytochrome d ubiquinol oxidase subunit II
MPELSHPAAWLPLVFMGLMGLAMLVYVVLDGYDLGVGMLFARALEPEKDMMVATIGPFWDANETWLVLGVGVLITAFPMAQGVILGSLYLPVALMLGGLILRGVAFDFRVKARAAHQAAWNRAFMLGSLVTSIAQGIMLGRYITGFDESVLAWSFALFVGASLPAAYCLLGAGWLIAKTEGPLQHKAVGWAKQALWMTALGIGGISLATPWVSHRIFEKWFAYPNFVFLAPIPVLTVALVVQIARSLARIGSGEHRHWAPFAATTAILGLAFVGLAYSMVPFLVVDRITVWQAAAAPQSLAVILAGVVVVLPAIALYSAYSYWVFRGKARELAYQ